MQKAAAAASEAYRETTEYEAEYRRFVAFARLQSYITMLEAENAALKAALDQVRGFSGGLRGTIVQDGASVTFGDPTPADLPDPPRRPDGTLQPQAKPLPTGALTQQAGGKRVGG